MYVMYAWRQNSDVFFESQFLHIAFLQDLISLQFSARGFFTVFGEHLFPGYNLVLALNYFLFGIWGGFDTWIFTAAVVGAALIVVLVVLSADKPPQNRLLCALGVGISMLSVTTNPQWGMALSAAIGVTLFIAGAASFSRIAGNEQGRYDLLNSSLCFGAAILLFSGGYAIGLVASAGIVLLMTACSQRKVSFAQAGVGAAVFVSLIAYALIVANYGSLLENRPTAKTFDLMSTIQFALVMSGASVLGKALFENTGLWAPYYVVGSVLLSGCFVFWFFAFRNRERISIFFFLLSFYSFCNILVVSLFRYRNGLEGAMGQWYNVHAHLLICGPLYCVFFSDKGRGISGFMKVVTIAILSTATLSGYVYDWKKAPYVAAYKDRFAAQAPLLLAEPRLVNTKDEFSTMLWNYPAVKEGLDLLYKNHLWRFKSDAPFVTGIDADGWVQASSVVTVLCPADSVQASFVVYRGNDWGLNAPLFAVNGVNSAISSGVQNVAINAPVSAITMQPVAEASNPGLRVASDKRLLAAKITGVSCLSVNTY